ncbi:MAG: phosphonopyruvate decarboxylase [bacterium]
MINCQAFYELLLRKNINFFCGVPDSLLKDICAYISDHTQERNHIIAANEGGAVALIAGYHLATGKIGLVYMQNSGQGNTVNPLISLMDREVYSIPALLLLGWRGEPGKKDEPQHIKQGRITGELLRALEIPFDVLPATIEDAEALLTKAVHAMHKQSAPYALVVPTGVFESYRSMNQIELPYELSREEAVKAITKQFSEDDIFVSTTGKTSRELFEYREELQQGHQQDFLTVGSMGHASQIALGIALARPDRNVYCLDGDGALIMHMGALAIIGARKPANFKHIVINNAAHDSVGGQPTAGFEIDIPNIARACGYLAVMRAESVDEIYKKLPLLQKSHGPALLEIRVNKGARAELGRPTTSPIENKHAFMKFLRR